MNNREQLSITGLVGSFWVLLVIVFTSLFIISCDPNKVIFTESYDISYTDSTNAIIFEGNKIIPVNTKVKYVNHSDSKLIVQYKFYFPIKRSVLTKYILSEDTKIKRLIICAPKGQWHLYRR